MDGGLGAYIRAQIDKAGLHAFEKMWDNGYRQMTTSTQPIKKPEDLQGLQDPRPAEPAVDLDVQGVRRRAESASTSRRSIRRCRPRWSRGRRTRSPII